MCLNDRRVLQEGGDALPEGIFQADSARRHASLRPGRALTFGQVRPSVAPLDLLPGAHPGEPPFLALDGLVDQQRELGSLVAEGFADNLIKARPPNEADDLVEDMLD